MTWLLVVLTLGVLVVGVLTLLCVLDMLEGSEGSGPSSFEAAAEIRRMRNQTVRDLFAAEAAARSAGPGDYIDGTAREVARR